MSTPPRPTRTTVPSFRARKRRLGGEPLVVLTAYDAATAAVGEAGGADALLVGDSLGMVVLGYETTLPVTMDEMLHHARAVGRTRKRALLIADMPWLSYHLSPEETVRNAARFVREAGADAVKIEGGRKRLPAIAALLDAEIPVMGHLGLTPQSVLALGGYRVQGRAEAQAKLLLEDASALEGAGVFAIVLEGIPSALASAVTEQVSIPTIGIGAGVGCDGQVLVIHDLLGMLPGGVPKFVRRYDSSHERQVEAVRRWAEDVRGGRFPAESEAYG
jgi:3-methyl-2-oxobutanoate hydroxymethyltransferase